MLRRPNEMSVSAESETSIPRFSGGIAGARDTPSAASTPSSLHVFLFAASCLVVLLAATMSIQDGAGVSLPGIAIPLPELCYFRRGVGLDCPGCGLTRSFIALAHGEIARAWQFNPAGLLLFPLVAFQIPYQAAQLLRLKSGRQPWKLELIGVGVFAAAVIAMFAQWIVKLAGL
jgi:hypothetical protein